MSDPAARPTRARSQSVLLERLVFFHFAIFIVVASWFFGGQSPGARQFIAWWGTLGMGLFLWVAWARRHADAGRLHPALRLLWPLWLYDALVIASCFNPGFVETMVAGQRSLVMGTPHPWLPTAALPRLAAREIWQFNGLVLSTFSLFLVLDRRSRVRHVLFLLAGNSLALAVFGTFQKLVRAKGLWFGLVDSPNSRFFATFIYHNHWGAFMLLNIAVCVALLFHYHRRGGHRDLWHSPVLLGAVVTLLLAASVPLSASRSCSVLVALLLVAALVHFLVRLIREQRATGHSALPRVAALLVACGLAAAAIGFIGRDSITERARQTAQQLSPANEQSVTVSRLTLYRDTWRMAAEKPWFGWGLESYAHVFRIYNTQRAAELWVWIPFYAEAHNDWFQALAETGFVGTGLLVLLGLLPLAAAPWRRAPSVVPRYLLAGCGLLLVYAFVEFPFANPVVVLTFCAVFYCAVRYAGLDARAQADER